MSWRPAALIFLIGFQLRSVILAVPPVLPELRGDLHLNFSSTGALTAIPVLGLGAAALPGALLVNRFGARRVIGLAALGLGLAAILRTAPPSPYSLFIWTAVLALFVATAQPAIAVLVRGWFPDHVQQAATLYAMSLASGGLVAATVSVYLLGLGGWRGTFVIWGLLAAVAAICWLRFAPGRSAAHLAEPHRLADLVRRREVWHVAGLFGGQSLIFYGGAAWIPFLLRNYDHTYLALVLFLFQVVSLPLTAVVSITRRRWATSRWWYTTGGVLMMIGSIGLMSGLTGLAWILAPVMGLGNSMVFVGSNALPPILAPLRSEVAAYTAIVLTAGYVFAFLGPIAGGVLLDLTGSITSPFWVLAVSAGMTVILGFTFAHGSSSFDTSLAKAE